MKVAIITHNFPHPRFPQSGAFVKKLTDGMIDAGADITVYSLISKSNFTFWQRKEESEVALNKKLKIRHLDYFSFSNINFLGCSSAEIGHNLALRKLIKQVEVDIMTEGTKPDILYGKFLMSGGRKAVELSKLYSVPAVADLGESSLLVRLSAAEIGKAREIVNGLSGVVCVSPRLASEAVSLGMSPDRVLMLPNGIDREKFYWIERAEARRALELPLDKKIILFVGHFIHRKGPNRVLKAIEQLPSDYCGIFIGEGPIKLESSRILYQGRVANHILNIWINACDVFCLPTLGEGSCNALEEARSVGLPIVTSMIDDITDFDSSKEYTLVDPLDIADIAKGILNAANSSRIKYRYPPISNDYRTKKILDWLSNAIKCV